MLTYLRKHMKAIMIIIAVLFAASMFYGLGFRGIQDQSLSKRGFLKVNGQEVDILRFNQIYSRLRESFPANLKPQEALFLQNLALNQTIDYALILEEARKKVRVSGGELNQVLEDLSKNQKFSSVSDFKKAVEKSGLKWNDLKRIVRDDILVSRMVNQVKAEVSVSANDLREVRARHILVKDEKLAQELLGRVKKGEDFAALAKKYSEDPGSRDKGGDLGFFPAGAMLKPFDNLAFSLKVGEIGGPVKTDFGYHIIKVEDARLRKIPGKTDPEKAILEEKQERAYH
jgi:foldase protein PrsA